MNWWHRITGWMARTRPTDYPMVTARISRDDADGFEGMVNRVLSGMSGIAAPFPFEIYDAMDAIFRMEPYCSRFLATTIGLGNTGHKLEISAGTEQRAREAIAVANDFAARCHPFAGGMDGVINGLFSQCCRAGGLCIEWAPDRAMTRIDRAYLVPVKSVRFQRLTDGELALCQVQDAKLVRLNPVQTAFHVIAAWDASPYPVPPAMAALKAIAKLRKFDDSIDGWLEKLAALGVFLATVERPPLHGETEDDYNRKAQRYLQDIAGSIRDNLRNGFACGYDNIKFSFQNAAAGAAGAKDLLQMVLQSVFAGLHRDPVFFGWNWGSTETFAKVVFEEMVGSITTIRQGIKRAIEHGHRLNLALNGFGDVGVSVKFNQNRSMDAFMHSEAEQMKSGAVVSEYAAGLIDRDEARKALGYDETAARSDAFVAAFNRDAKRYELLEIRRGIRRGVAKGGQVRQEAETIALTVTNVSEREASDAAKQYLWAVRRILSDAGRAGVDAVYAWALLNDVPVAELFVGEALRRFVSGAEQSISQDVLKKLASEHIERIWRFGKNDHSLFPDWDRDGRGFGIALGMPDYQAIAYLERLDRFYVSKYVSHSPQRSKQIAEFLRSQYLEQGLGRGGRPREMAEFKERFGDLVEGIGEHATRVIIDTGVARAQNWSAIFAFAAHGVKEYRVTGPRDRLTCRYCLAMLGRVFTVETERTRIETIIETGEEDITKFDRFITSRYGTKAGLQALEAADDTEVQASGMVTPPFHPLCRHRMIAVVK